MQVKQRISAKNIRRTRVSRSRNHISELANPGSRKIFVQETQFHLFLIKYLFIEIGVAFVQPASVLLRGNVIFLL